MLDASPACDPEFIHEAYTNVVNHGLKRKGPHAINICFGKFANHFIYQCFESEDKTNRLYDIRISINHREVKAENPHELARIESCLKELRTMILNMFGQIIPYTYPLHRDSSKLPAHHYLFELISIIKCIS